MDLDISNPSQGFPLFFVVVVITIKRSVIRKETKPNCDAENVVEQIKKNFKQPRMTATDTQAILIREKFDNFVEKKESKRKINFWDIF